MDLSRRQFSTFALSAAVLATAPTAALSGGPSIEGRWYYNGQPCHIRVNGWDQVKLRNNEGRKATGTFQGPWTISVPEWNVNGSIQNGGNKIAWSNGTVWTRYPAEQTHISGRWYRGNRPCKIQVYDNGWGVTITNEDGDSYNGRAQGSNSIYIPAINVTGHVSYDAKTISWSNGTTWTRSPSGGGGRGPFTSHGP